MADQNSGAASSNSSSLGMEAEVNKWWKGRRIERNEVGGGGERGAKRCDAWGKEQMGDDGVRVKVWRKERERERGERDEL